MLNRLPSGRGGPHTEAPGLMPPRCLAVGRRGASAAGGGFRVGRIRPSVPHSPGTLPPLLAALAGLVAMAGGLASVTPPVAAQSDARAPRPADLVILQRSHSVNGEKQVGVFGAKADPRVSGLWSVQVWEETDDRVTIATDRIGCTATSPLRITGSGGQVWIRQLNPGGAIQDSNRLDHLIWWAVCHPSLAGRDPAGLAPEARRLGYSLRLPEEQQLLQAPGR